MTSTPHVESTAWPGRIVTAFATVAILVATLIPARQPGADVSFGCVFCGERALSDVLVNVILFVPLGIGMALRGLPPRRAVLAGGLLSAVIEFAQILIIAGRDASVGDILTNTIGTAVGVALVWLVREVASLDDRMSARLSIAAALDVALAVLLTGWLLQPSFPQTTYWGQWTPRLGHLEWYRSRISSARIDGVEVRSRRIEDSEWAREALLRGDSVDITFTAGPPVGDLGSLFSIYDGDRREIFLLGPDGNELVLRYRTRASDVRLDQPDLRLPKGWSDVTPGSPYRVSVWSPQRGQWCVDGPVTEHCDLGFTVGAGWGLLYYAEWFPPWMRQVLSTAWAAALLVTTGFFVRNRWEGAVAAVLILSALGVLPGHLALRPTQGLEWAGALFGLAIGAIAARMARGGRGQGGVTRGA